MAKKPKKNEPPSLFDNLDLFSSTPKLEKDESGEEGEEKLSEAEVVTEKKSEDPVAQVLAPVSTSVGGVTGQGPLRKLMNDNFLQ